MCPRIQIEKQANELEKTSGKRRMRSIMATLWSDDYNVRQNEFDKVCKIWIKELKFVCYGAIEKTEENKKPHCHVLIMFNGQKQWKTIIKTLDPHIYHIEAVHSPKAAYSYCRKEDPDNLLEFGEPPNQGNRTDLKKLVDENQGSIEKIMETDPNTYSRYRNGLLDYCEYVKRPKRILDRLKCIQNENGEYVKDQEKVKGADVKWFYGPAGSGKSKRVEEEIMKLLNEKKCEITNISVVDEIANDFFIGDIAETTDVLWLDDFRGSDMKYNKLLKLIDGRNVNVKGGKKFIKPKYIFITSPMTPQDCYHNLSYNDGIDQLLRRITEIVDFTPEID